MALGGVLGGLGRPWRELERARDRSRELETAALCKYTEGIGGGLEGTLQPQPQPQPLKNFYRKQN